ncbi:MAG TPA: hypothetical protein DIT97_10580 [Gimesia maris]|uniref:DNA2/NAM7 helicase-like C-terminal domain-containing protein n=1 Tax=Gimesia maris TaxID=122 RepID=A0A3D3R790_9PLAN|nr:hypothetical protein [Gimesia maris]|tara:strand:+ start:9469 stop:11196 length:1728 start_codon:yes stop_codon:yes gene_type:complete
MSGNGSRQKELSIDAIEQMLDSEIETRLQFIRRLENSPIEKVISSGEVLGPLNLIDHDGHHQFLETKGYYSRFRKGDNVQIRISGDSNSSEHLFDTTVHDLTYPSEGKLCISIGNSRKEKLDSHTEYFIYPTENEFLHNKLKDCILSCDRSLYRNRISPQLDSKKVPSKFLDRLNSSQIEAFNFLSSSETDAAVQGPPGTGKTQLLLALVAQALACNLSVGIAAFTHAAVDNALSRIANLDVKHTFCRVGRSEMIKRELYPQNWLHGRTAKSFGSIKGYRPQLFASTTHSWALSPAAPKVDLLIIDEAGQVPVYFMPVLLSTGYKIFCLGDHKQLPPVLQGDHSGTVEHTDIFSQFLSKHSPMLEIQYRMNSQIQAWPSTQFYGGRLQPHLSNQNRDVLSTFNGPKNYLGRRPLQLITHKKYGNSSTNLAEASLVAELVDRLFKVTEYLPANQIGIISPKRMHNGAINQALQSKFGVVVASQIHVDTVERFQGQEREVILFSFGSDRRAPAEDEISFIGDAQRLNVAITRARSRFYCFATEELASLREASIEDKQDALPGFFASFAKKNRPKQNK